MRRCWHGGRKPGFQACEHSEFSTYTLVFIDITTHDASHQVQVPVRSPSTHLPRADYCCRNARPLLLTFAFQVRPAVTSRPSRMNHSSGTISSPALLDCAANSIVSTSFRLALYPYLLVFFVSATSTALCISYCSSFALSIAHLCWLSSSLLDQGLCVSIAHIHGLC